MRKTTIRDTERPRPRFLLVIAILFPLILPGAVPAHEYWLDLSDFTPEIGREVEVRLCAGHYFPRSAFLLIDGVADGPVLTLPCGDTIHVSTIADGKSRVGTITPDSTGVHMLSFSISHLYAPAPYYEGRVFMLAGEGQDDPALYASGSGLELVPGLPLSTLAEGDELPVSLYLDGARVPGTLTMLMEDGKSGYFDIGGAEDLFIPLRRAGRHLLTASIQGRVCSLVFLAGEDEK